MTLSAGEYVVTVSANGYVSQSKSVDISEGETVEMSFALEPTSEEPDIVAQIIQVLIRILQDILNNP